MSLYVKIIDVIKKAENSVMYRNLFIYAHLVDRLKNSETVNVLMFYLKVVYA